LKSPLSWAATPINSLEKEAVDEILNLTHGKGAPERPTSNTTNLASPSAFITVGPILHKSFHIG
jgi:hypothetical protein